jgi:outer membrane protein OmpA-like peptidoglycan-associated protein
MAGNDTPGTATPVVIASVGAGYDSGLVANTGLTVAGSADEPETFVTGAPWYRVGWWRYRPTADGTMNVYNGPGLYVGVMSVYSGTPGALVYINAYYGNGTHTIEVAAGQTYWFSLGMLGNDSDASYRLQLSSAPTSVPETPAVVNDSPATATAVVITNTGAGYDTGLVANTGLSNAGSVDEPTLWVTGVPWYRVGWWRYRPTADGTMNVYNGPTRNVGVLSVFSGTPGALVYINAYYGGDTHTLAVAAGQTYWFAVGNIEGNGDDNYRLQVTSAPTSVPEDPGGGGVTPTPLDLGTATLTVPVLLAAAPLEDRNRLDAGPVGVPVHLAPAVLRNTGGVVVAAGVARIVLSAPAPALAHADVDLVDPADGSVLPGARPVFTVQVSTDDADARVEIAYDRDPAFGDPTIVSAAAAAGLADAQLTVPAGQDLDDQAVYSWRARIANTVGVGPWSDPWVFAVDLLEGQAVAAGSLTVTAGATPAPHLWHVRDGAGTDAGQTLIAVGTGFGPTPVAHLGDLPCPTEETQDVADTGAGSGRRIDPAGRVDPYHQQLPVTVPPVDADHPGDVLSIAGGNGTFLPLRPAAPLPGIGWTVAVYAHTDLLAYAKGLQPRPIARIAQYIALSWSPEISGVGAGSITLARTAALFGYNLADGRPATVITASPNLFVVYQDGQWRGEFLGEKVSWQQQGAGEAADQTCTISGPGSGQVLNWAKVMTPYYPRTPPKAKIGVFQFKNQPVMACWLQLLYAAQRRGTIPFVHTKFSATRDSGGAVWEDTAKPKPSDYDAQVLAGDVGFASNSSTLSPAGIAACTALAKKLAKVTYPIVTVTGHTDSNGSTAANKQLSLDRASSVADYILAARPLAQVSTVGAGESQPIASNRTAAGRRKNRRVRVVYQKNPAYVDTVYTPELGTGLLDLLSSMTSGQTTAENRGPIHCEWIMQKGFQLHVRSLIGTDRSQAVVYHEGSSYLATETFDYDRADIANLVAVQNEQGVYAIAASGSAIAQWGQRELFTRLSGSYAAAVQAQIARTQLEAYRDQQTSATVTVVPGYGRRPFQDYGLGDWIGLARRHRGLAPSTIDRQRVMAITVTVNADGVESYELKLQSARASRLSWLQLQIDALTNRKQGVRTFIQDDEPTGGVPGDLWTPAILFTSDV